MPGNHTYTELMTKKGGVAAVEGSFAPNGSSALVATSIVGQESGFTVARTGVGIFLITFEDAWVRADIIAELGGLSLSAPASTMVQFGTWTDGTSSAGATLQILAVNSSTGAAADIAANNDNRISFLLLFRRSYRV